MALRQGPETGRRNESIRFVREWNLCGTQRDLDSPNGLRDVGSDRRLFLLGIIGLRPRLEDSLERHAFDRTRLITRRLPHLVVDYNRGHHHVLAATAQVLTIGRLLYQRLGSRGSMRGPDPRTLRRHSTCCALVTRLQMLRS